MDAIHPRLTLEIIAASVDDAVAAAAGGADRLEVVRDLASGGLTPTVALVRDIQRAVDLPLRVMVRESDGFGVQSDAERHLLSEHARAFETLHVDGIVLGWTRDTQIDEETLAAVLDAAPALRVTFHRAFDSLPDPERNLGVLQRYSQIDRVLTGAGSGAWASRCATLERYVQWAAPHLTILPGGSLDVESLAVVAACRGVTEAHIGRAARLGRTSAGAVSAGAVRELRRVADRIFT